MFNKKSNSERVASSQDEIVGMLCQRVSSLEILVMDLITRNCLLSEPMGHTAPMIEPEPTEDSSQDSK